MNESRHFTNFKKSHKQHRMPVAIAQPTLTAPNGNGTGKKMQGTVHLPERLPVKIRFREALRSFLFRGWEQVVVNKSVDSITMPKWIASSILGTMLLFGVSSWWRASDQRDMIIEMRTELRLAKENEAEKAKELKSQADMNKVYIDNMTNQLNVIRGMLSQQQLNAVNESRR